MAGAYDRDGVVPIPSDLEKTNAAAAASAQQTSRSSYTKKINLPLVRNKKYKFFFTYKYEDPDTKEITESDKSPVWIETYAIPNLTKGVLNLTLTPGYKSYGVKFDIDPTSIQEDIVIFESLSSTSIGNVVYIGTSTNVTIPTNSIATRWVTVRTRDKWEDLNVTDVGPLSVTPLNPDPDTTYTVANPTNPQAAASIDPKDLSGFSLVSTITWTQSADIKTAGYAIRWSTNDPSVVGSTPLWEYASVSGITTTSFTATGLIPNTTYYYQIASTTPYDVVNWTGAASGTFIASDADGTAAGALARLKSFIAIGGASQDLFKIGTGISQSINLNTDPIVSPTLTAGTYHGIILNKSTTNVGNNFWLTTGQFRVGNPTEFMYWNGTNLYLTGNINATGGKFTGNVQLAIPTGGTTSGTLYAGANPDTGQRIRLNSSGIFAYSSQSTGSNFQTFSLDTAGYMNAKSGLIGGWNLGETTLSNNGVILNSSTGQISVGATPSTSVYLSSTGDFRMWAGSQSPTDAAAKFKVDSNGILYAQGAVIGLGAGSTGPFATTDSLSAYATTASLSGYATTGSVAAKNSTFAQDTQPVATRVGDIWIDTANGNIIKTWTGSVWTTRTDTTYATKTALSTKLEAGGYLIANAQQQVTGITSNGITITSSGFKINTDTAATPGANMVILNSAGLAAYDSTGTATFAIDSSGNASFKGNISGASGTFSGKLAVGTPGDYGSSDFFQTSYLRNGRYVTGLNGVAFESLTTSGWITANYPFYDNDVDLGVNEYTYPSGPRAGETWGPYRWRNARLTGFLSIAGNGSTNTPGGTNGPRTQLQADGNIYANYLGLATGTALVQSGGYIRVSSSSRRYKENIVPITGNYLELVNTLQPVRFSYKPEFSKVEINPLTSGLIAEDVHEIEGLRSIVNYNDDNDPESVSYDRLSIFLAMAIKELSNKVDALSTRLDALEA
jgi:hypothetical protein